jgi:hypothetical protein
MELIPSEGIGYALSVEMTSAGDEDVPISGVFLCRKGINAFPEFAQAFGFDTSQTIEGLPPEQYQIRVQMMVSHQGKLLYGDGKSEFKLPPGKKVKFVMPLPFQCVPYFFNSPPDDLFIAASNLGHDEQIVEVTDVHTVLAKSVEEHGHLGRPYNVHLSLLVPQSAPMSEDTLKKVGTKNPNPVRPMPNN